MSPDQMKAEVTKIVQGQRDLLATSPLKGMEERAELLRFFVTSRDYSERQAALEAFVTNGKDAVPVLEAMLDDETLQSRHGDIVEALAKAGGSSVGDKLTALLERETAFWKQKAPALKTGWWNGKGLEWPEVKLLRDHYSTLLSTLYSIKQVGSKGSRDAVVRLRDYWVSLPQLDDRSGLNQMSGECKAVLQRLDNTTSQ